MADARKGAAVTTETRISEASPKSYGVASIRNGSERERTWQLAQRPHIGEGEAVPSPEVTSGPQ